MFAWNAIQPANRLCHLIRQWLSLWTPCIAPSVRCDVSMKENILYRECVHKISKTMPTIVDPAKQVKCNLSSAIIIRIILFIYVGYYSADCTAGVPVSWRMNDIDRSDCLSNNGVRNLNTGLLYLT